MKYTLYDETGLLVVSTNDLNVIREYWSSAHIWWAQRYELGISFVNSDGLDETRYIGYTEFHDQYAW